MRRWAGLVLLAAVAGTALLGVGSAMQPDVYRSSVEIVVAPVSPRVLYDPEAASWGPEVSMARELQFARSAAVEEAIDEAVAPVGDVDLDIDIGSRGTAAISVQAEATDPDSAAYAAVLAGLAYAEAREEAAVAGADEAIAAAEARIAALDEEGAAVDDPARVEAEADLDLATEGREVLARKTAYLAADPVVPDAPVSPTPWLAAGLGALLGASLGLAVATVLAGTEPARAPGSRRGRPDEALIGVAGENEGSAGGATRTEPGWARRVAAAATGGGAATLASLAALVLVRAGVYAVQGVNLVLDDLTLSSNAERFGLWNVVPSQGQQLASSRPGAWLTFNALYGPIGARPLVLFAVVTVLNVAVVWLLYTAARRFLPVRAAACLAGLWVVLPTHTTLTVWPGTAQVVVGLALFLLGVWALADGRWLGAGLALAASILCYELVNPLCVVLPLVVGTKVLPLLPEARQPRLVLTWPRRAGTLFLVGAATVWSRAHSTVYADAEYQVPSVRDLWSAHFGLGLFGSFSTPDLLVMATGGLVAVGVVLSLIAWVRGERGRTQGPSLVLVGGCIMGLGVPAAFTLAAGPLGLADRLYGVTSIGSALVLMGIAMWLWSHSRAVTTVAVVGLVAVCAVGQVVAMASWSKAGDDVVALLRYLDVQDSPETTVFLVQPGPLNRNGVVGATSPTGGANEIYLQRYPGATGQLIIDSGQADLEVPDDAVVVRWSDVFDEAGSG